MGELIALIILSIFVLPILLFIIFTIIIGIIATKEVEKDRKVQLSLEEIRKHNVEMQDISKKL